MKKYILLTAIMMLTVSALMAQNPNERKRGDRSEMMEKIKAKKAAYLTTKMDLSPAQAEKFWPVYNSYEKQMDELKSSYTRSLDLDSLSDAEVENYILKDFEKRQKFLDLNREAFDDYKKILPMKQIAKLKLAEREFTKEVLYRYKNKTAEKRKNKQ